MRLLRRALEGVEENNSNNIEEKTIVMKGPLSEIYTQALDAVYAKENPTDTSEVDVEPNKEGEALEGLKDKSTSSDSSSKKVKESFKPVVKKGSFHDWLGKKKDEPITDADIEKGLKSKDPHVKKMAQFAKNAKKWHHKKKDKPATESFNGEALESIADELVSKIVLESQQMDAAILQKITAAMIDPEVKPTDNFQTVYGVSRDDVTEDTVVDVTSELANQSDNHDFVMVIDATQPGNNGETVGVPEEHMVNMTEALETIVEAHGYKVYHSFSEYIDSRK